MYHRYVYTCVPYYYVYNCVILKRISNFTVHNILELEILAYMG